MVTYRYIIKGEPLHHMASSERYTGKSWTKYSSDKIKFLISLESQQETVAFLKGPLSLEIFIYCTRMFGRGDLSSYIKFIEYILKGVVYKDFNDVHAITTVRTHVTADPSTTIVISHIGEE